VATADRIYADPSALLKLYRHEPESRAVAAWRGTIKGPLRVTHHGRVELTNGIALAAHRGLINESAFEAAVAALDDDFEQGRYSLAEIPWRAADLSRQHSGTLGTRTLDVIHVASALELGSKIFVTFDHRQQSLAKATGLKILAPAR
jgi:predicted nucleic acid-binding protein